MVTDWSDSQYANVESPILVTEFGMVTDWSDEQPLNPSSPINVTEF